VFTTARTSYDASSYCSQRRHCQSAMSDLEKICWRQTASCTSLKRLAASAREGNPDDDPDDEPPEIFSPSNGFNRVQHKGIQRSSKHQQLASKHQQLAEITPPPTDPETADFGLNGEFAFIAPEVECPTDIVSQAMDDTIEMDYACSFCSVGGALLFPYSGTIPIIGGCRTIPFAAKFRSLIWEQCATKR
jgi:hypothetical protein